MLLKTIYSLFSNVITILREIRNKYYSLIKKKSEQLLIYFKHQMIDIIKIQEQRSVKNAYLRNRKRHKNTYYEINKQETPRKSIQ